MPVERHRKTDRYEVILKDKHRDREADRQKAIQTGEQRDSPRGRQGTETEWL